jgi:OOP family OmpA-OmpF porin
MPPHLDPRPFAFRRVLAQAFVLGLIPLGTAFAQSQVRVTRDDTDISVWRNKKEVRLTASKGTLLDVFHVEGDRYNHRDSNWYWVLLPPDGLGSRPAGWIRGDRVEHVPPPPEAAMAGAASPVDVRSLPEPPRDAADSSSAAAAAPAALGRTTASRAPAAAPAAAPVMADVVLTFPFDRSDLTDEARRKLASAMSVPGAQRLSIALEGHADWTGPEGYNERLGLARAESVRRYLAEELRISVDRISVVSFGETSPAATNATREGRALNRRVVIKAGA